MARSGHQCQQGALRAPDRDEEARRRISEVFDANDGIYGRRRIHDELKAGGETIGERRIARIMAEEGLEARGRTKPKRRYSSYAGEITEHPGNKVRQDFAAGLPNFLWLTDVTQFSIPAGKPCPDSSRMEGFFGTMKNEMFYGRDWEGVSLEELGKRIDDYIEWYNTKRIRRSLGSMSPLAYRQSLALAA
jgi:transposase InsO family protein